MPYDDGVHDVITTCGGRREQSGSRKHESTGVRTDGVVWI